MDAQGHYPARRASDHTLHGTILPAIFNVKIPKNSQNVFFYNPLSIRYRRT